MKKEDFFQKIEEEIGDMDPGTIKGQMAFKDIPNWSSMHFLILIALCDTEYNVKVTGEDFRSCKNLDQFFDLVKNRI